MLLAVRAKRGEAAWAAQMRVRQPTSSLLRHPSLILLIQSLIIEVRLCLSCLSVLSITASRRLFSFPDPTSGCGLAWRTGRRHSA